MDSWRPRLLSSQDKTDSSYKDGERLADPSGRQHAAALLAALAQDLAINPGPMHWSQRVAAVIHCIEGTEQKLNVAELAYLRQLAAVARPSTTKSKARDNTTKREGKRRW
jgi:hypothetical protein